MGEWRWVYWRGKAGFIRIAVKTDVVLAVDVAEVKEVNDEEEGPQDRALGVVFSVNIYHLCSFVIFLFTCFN